MRDLIQVICENLDRTIEVEMGTSLLDIQRQYLPKGPHPYLAAYVNNRIKELNYKVYTPINASRNPPELLNISSFDTSVLGCTVNQSVHAVNPAASKIVHANIFIFFIISLFKMYMIMKMTA